MFLPTYKNRISNFVYVPGLNSSGQLLFSIFFCSLRDHYHYDILIKQVENGKQTLNLRYHIGNLIHTEKEIPVQAEQLYVRVTGENDWYRFSYSEDGVTYQEIGKMDTRLLSTETAGGFTGIMLGLYATSASPDSQAEAEIEWFDYQPAR